MQNKQNRIKTTVIVLLAIVGISLGIVVSQYMHRAPTMDRTQFHGAWLDKPRSVSEFHLEGTNQASFNNASLLHHWTMVFFGFTSCSSICPTTMAELSKMERLLEDQGVTPLPQVALISLDSEHDSLERLKQYVTAFNPHFIAARGANDDAIKTLTQEIGIAVTKVPSPTNQQQYTIDHTGTIMLFNPEGKLCAFFTMPHESKQLAEDYRLVIASQT